jgi:hypothetical protein
MRGLLADINVDFHATYLRGLLEHEGSWDIFEELGTVIARMSDLQLPHDIDDRRLWTHCQKEGWVLFTDNRNHDGEDSLTATLADSWQQGHLPVLTLGNKRRFEDSAEYRTRVAISVAGLLFGIAEEGRYLDQPRIFVPL